MLNITNLNVAIGGSRILRNLTLEVPANRLVCLMGRNGVGKSTTLKTIVGLLRSSSGEMQFDGQNILRIEARGARPPGHRLCAAGPRYLSAPYRAGKSPDRPGGARAGR